MTTHKEALTLALEALETHVPHVYKDRGYAPITAIKEALAQEQPEQDCTRSHPHEEMSKACELRTEIARLTNCLARANAQAEHFEREWYLRGDEIERLKAQPEQEPVGRIAIGTNKHPYAVLEKCYDKTGDCWIGDELLYTTPPQRKPLTDEMVTTAARVLSERQADACGVDRDDQWAIYSDDFKADARAMLKAAHGIKE